MSGGVQIDWNSVGIQLVGIARHDFMPTPQASPSLYDQTLWIIHRGRARVRLDGRDCPAEAGTVFWFRPRLHPQTWFARNQKLLVSIVRFRLPNLPASVGAGSVWAVPEWNPGLDAAWLEGLCDRLYGMTEGAVSLRTAVREEKRVWAEALLRVLVMEIVQQAGARARQAKRPDVWDPILRGVCDWAARISENPVGLPSVQEMAATLNVSVGYFSVRFKEYTSHSPQRFALIWRIRHACRLLLETPHPVKSIAETLGYSDVFFFSRQFKRITGLTPTAYRKRGVSGG